MLASKIQQLISRDQSYAPAFIGLTTLAIFIVDLYLPLGFALWLPYFVLAFAVSRLNRPSTLILATLFWSVAILGAPLLHQHAGDDLAYEIFNRALGVVTIWLLTGLLVVDNKTRQAKLNSEARYRAIVQGALDAVVTIDSTGLVGEWNPQAESIFGYSEQEAVGKRLAELIIPPQFREAHAKGMQRYLSTGEETILRRRIEITALHKNGEEFPVELTIIPLHLDKRVQFSSFIRDLTKQKEAIHKLKISEERYQLAVNGSTDGIWDWDIVTQEAYFSPRYKALLGYSDQDFPDLISSFWTHLHPEDHQWVSTAFKAHLAQKSPYDIEYRLRTKSGEYRWYRTRGQALWAESGAPIRMAGSITDITKAKVAESALVQGQLELQRASQAKSEFLANMSHEMRTPLNAITGITDFLAQAPLTPEQLALVRRCGKASDSLLRMIEDLLLAAKTESGTLELVAEPFVLEDMVAECTGLLATEAKGKGLPLTLHMEPGLPTDLIGDAHRLRQVLLNLIRNAIKFTPAGSIAVHAALVSQQQDKSVIRFEVSDTGVGIPAELHERIFERFSQADSRVARQYGGVGLGLSICKQLVEMMGGHIGVDSKPGKGSTFSFTIPLTAVPPDSRRASTSRPTLSAQNIMKDAAGQTSARRLRILLAEDSIESQNIMKLYLRHTPHQLDCAETGISVVEQFKTGEYDLVFMDLQMPEMDGYTATYLIRAWEIQQKRPPTPIIALTANSLNQARIESQAAGCTEFLTKPIKMSTLLGVIQRHYAGDTGTPTAQSPSSSATMDQSVIDEMMQLKRQFIRNRYHDVTALQAATTKNDFDDIRTTGHRIKGLAGSFGLHDIGAIGSHIEEAAMAQDSESLTRYIRELSDAVRDAERAASNEPDIRTHAA